MATFPIELHPEVLSSKRTYAFHYDAGFFIAFNNLVDDFANMFNKHQFVDFDPGSYVTLSFAVNLLIDRIREDYSLEETTSDNIHSDFSEALAGDLIEIVANFVNSAPYPNGLQEVIRTLPDDFYLIEVFLDKDQDLTWYSFDDGEDKEYSQ